MALREESTEENPLMRPSELPFGAPPLEGLKVEYFLPALKKAIKTAEKSIAKIKNSPEAPTFENTIEALESADKEVSWVARIFSNVVQTNGNEELRAIESEINTLWVKHSSSVIMDEELFARVRAIHDMKETLKLTPEQNMLLEDTYKGFIRSGALLDADIKQELRDIEEKLSELSKTFRNNTTYATNEYKKVIDDESELAGVPERAKNIYKQFAEEKGLPGKWIIGLSPPPLDILTYCENRALREEIYMANSNIADQGKYDNGPLILEIVKLRQRKAKLLGYTNYPAFVLDERMAKTPETVMAFLEKNLNTYKPEAEKFMQQVRDYAIETDGLTDLKPWDVAYYRRRLTEETFKVNVEEIRPYFDLEKSFDGLRVHAEKLFNITLTEAKGKYPVYHPDVRAYEVKDKNTGDVIGLFYTDYYARAGAKRNGAWETTFRSKSANDIPIVVNVCNFDKPTKDQPALLSLREVRTLFHEFGHGLHDLLAQGNYASLNGTNVKWDFVELPSQLQENWAVEKDVLDTFAFHYKTGQQLPPGLVQKIKDMDNFETAYIGLRQTFLGLLDMKWYTTDPATIKSISDLEDQVEEKTALFPREGAAKSYSFNHIFAGGYAVGYYSYKWAEVLDADVFSDFKKNGLYDSETADRLRATIYSKGGTVNPMEIFQAMMGRKPDADALFRREGLLPASGKKPQKPQKPKAPKPPQH